MSLSADPVAGTFSMLRTSEGPVPEIFIPRVTDEGPDPSSSGPAQSIQVARLDLNMGDALKTAWPKIWGTLTDGLNNAAKLVNSAPVLLGSKEVPFAEVLPNLFTTVLGAGADVAFGQMGAQEIGQSFLWARRPLSTEGEVKATPVELTQLQARYNLAYSATVTDGDPGRSVTISSMAALARQTGSSQAHVFTVRNPLLGMFKAHVVVAPDGAIKVALRDEWRWSSTTSDGRGLYGAHGGGAARNATAVPGELLVLGKRVAVPVSSEPVVGRLLPRENRSDLEIFRSLGPPLDPVRARLRNLLGPG